MRQYQVRERRLIAESRQTERGIEDVSIEEDRTALLPSPAVVTQWMMRTGPLETLLPLATIET